MDNIKLTYLEDILALDRKLVPDFNKRCLTRDFVNTKRFSPVIYDKEQAQPDKDDPNYELWWHEQYRRCIKGYIVPKATKRGHDIWIPGRMYFYLNFWVIFALLENGQRKDKRNPKFTSLDYFKFMVIEMMFYYKKDNMFPKSRQTGFSEYAASNIGYNFIFLPGSVNVIVAGMGDYAEKTMQNVIGGLDNLGDSEFYKRRSPNRSDYVKSSYREEYIDEETGEKRTLHLGFGSEVYCITAKDNTQAVSRLSPFFIVYEECFGKGTKILMSDGSFKKIENIIVGDKVLNSNNNIVEVAQIGSGIGQLYKINQSKGESYIVNNKHRLYLESKTNIKGYKDYDGIKKLTVDEINSLNTTKRKTLYGVKSNGIELSKKDISIDPYILGLWLGDGANKSMCITTQDDIIENALINFAIKEKLNYKTTYYKNSSNRKVNISGNKTDITKRLISLNLINNKHIPYNYLKNTLKNRLKLLAGLIDTDGNLHKGRSYSFRYEITQKLKVLIDDIKELAMSCGFSVSISSKIINKTVYYRLLISGELSRIPVKLKRKIVPKNYKHTSNPLNTQIQIEDIGYGEYYGITLKTENDEERVLVINDYTLSMNCGKWKKDTLKETTEYVRPSLRAEGVKTGWQLFIGTGGSMDESVSDVQDMAYNPGTYDLLEFDNIWEEQEINNKNKVAAFIPSYEFEIIDENGNALIEESKIVILELFEKKNITDRYKAMSQRPFYLSQMFMIGGGGFLGETALVKLNDRKRWLLTHPEQQIAFNADIDWIDVADWQKGVVLTPNPEGKFLIQQRPENDSNGKVWRNLYGAATDSYDKDESNSSFSMGSCTIWKNALDAKSTYDHWVARVTERPSEDEGGSYMFYEDTVKLCILYGECENLIEYSNVLIFDYYKRKGVEYLLQERPQMVISQYVEDGKASQKYGIEQSFIPHALNIWRDRMKQDDYAIIDRMFDLVMIEAFAKFRKAKNYNCDITISCALNTASAIEREDQSAYSEGEDDDEDFGGFVLDLNGNVNYSEN